MSTTTEEEILNEASESTPVPEDIKHIRIFINHLDSYQGQAIAKILPLASETKANPVYSIFGTIEGKEPPGKVAMKFHTTSLLSPTDCCFVEDVIKSDVIIYDIGSHSSQVDEAQKVLAGLEQYCSKLKNDDTKRDVVKYFILISTPLTWAKTPPVEEDSDILTEEYYRKRRNHHCFVKHKCLEREMMNMQKRCKPHLRTVVVCPGFTYGEANDIFHYVFKLGFYNKEIIPLFIQENNYVPLVYIKDFGRMIKQIIENFPEPSLRYILAVQSKLMTLKTFIKTIVFSLSGNVTKIKHVAPEHVLKTYEDLIPASVFHAITMNIKMAPKYFEDFDFSFEENFEDFGAILSDEFRRARNLLPIKIIIDGPPAVGKTTLAKCLADYYKLHYIDICTVINIVVKFLREEIKETYALLESLERENKGGQDTAEDQDIEDDLLDMEDRLNEMLEEWQGELDELEKFLAAKEKNPEDEFQFTKRCLLKLLSTNPCNDNQGYVLDGFPFDYSQAAEIFPRNTPEGEEAIEEDENGTLALKPDYVILLDAPDELLCKRAMALTEKEAVATKNTEEEFLARLEKYRERNQEDNSLLSFFYDNNIIPMSFCITEETTWEDIFDKIKEEIGPPHIYPATAAELKALERWEHQLHMMKEMEEKKLKEEAAAKEREEREANLQKWTKEFERLKCKEQEMFEAKTLPLRQYLAKFVLPTLTDGLMRVAEEKPEDPIDFLSEYLFECNPNGHVLDPGYSDKVKSLLLDEGDEDISKALDMMAENETDFDCDFMKMGKPSRSEASSSSSMSQRKHKEVEESNIAKLFMRELKLKKSPPSNHTEGN